MIKCQVPTQARGVLFFCPRLKDDKVDVYLSSVRTSFSGPQSCFEVFLPFIPQVTFRVFPLLAVLLPQTLHVPTFLPQLIA